MAARAVGAAHVVTLSAALDTPPRGGAFPSALVAGQAPLTLAADSPLAQLHAAALADAGSSAQFLGGVHVSVLPEWEDEPAPAVAAAAAAVTGAVVAAAPPRLRALHIAYVEVGVAAGDSAAPMPAAATALTLVRQVRGTGLHRDLTFAVHARVRVPGGTAACGNRTGGSGSDAAHLSPVPHCRLALVQRLEASTYWDLDELREAQRQEERFGRAAFGLHAFAPHIDVEKPTSASTQHIVILTMPVEVVGGGEAAASAPARALLAGGKRAASDGSREVDITANISTLLHLRYQAVGCDSASAGARDAAAAAAAPWTAIMAGVWGPLRADGSVALPATGAAGAPVGHPFVEGCYALAHLPQPTVHLACEAGELAAATAEEAAVAESCTPEALLVAAMADRHGAWMDLTATLTGGASSLPGQRGYSAVLTPPLAPVPIGSRDHAGVVFAFTASVAVACSLLLSRAALQHVHARHAA